MKVCLVVHGWPPRLRGGTENSVRELALALARAGDQVLVVAGTLGAGPTGECPRGAEVGVEAGLRLLHLERDDLYIEHWQKASSPAVERAFRALLRAERPAVVHVHHWLRLSDGLVLAAAREGVPALLSLHDHFASCLLVARAHPREQRPCERPAAALECVRCAASRAPRTPWLPLEQQMIAFEARRARLAREALLARRRIVPSRAHARALARLGGAPWSELDYEVVPPLRRGLVDGGRRPLLPPTRHGRLVLGSWGHASPIKGLELLRRAVERARRELGLEIELRAAGALAGAAYDPETLPGAEVAAVHAMVAPSLALESYGIVLDEARELGLVCVLPRAGAFVERAAEGEGVLFHEPGDERDLARVLARLAREPGLLEELRRRLPTPARGGFDETVGSLRALYREVVDEGPPAADELPPEEWFSERLAAAVIEAWDAACSRTGAAELGLEQAQT